MGSQVIYTIQINEIVGSDGSVLPLDVIDKYRLVSNYNQIGRRYWDGEWLCWEYEILEVKSGADVTKFINEQ